MYSRTERIFEKWNKDRNGASRRVKYTWDELVVRARVERGRGSRRGRERKRTEGVIASIQVRRTRHGPTHNPISPILSVGKYNPE